MLTTLVILCCITIPMRCKFCHLSTFVKCSIDFLLALSQNPTLFFLLWMMTKCFQLLYLDDTGFWSSINGKGGRFKCGFEGDQMWHVFQWVTKVFNGKPQNYACWLKKFFFMILCRFCKCWNFCFITQFNKKVRLHFCNVVTG